MKRKVGIVAAAVMATTSFAQLAIADQERVAGAPSAHSSARFMEVVNPRDSGYLGPVAADRGYQEMASRAGSDSLFSRFRDAAKSLSWGHPKVVNPRNSGYLGPVVGAGSGAAGESES